MESMDKMDAAGLMHGMMEVAKGARASHKYSEDEAMMPVAIIIAREDVKVVATAWRNEREKWAMMRMVSDQARRDGARIVGLATDTRWVKSDALCRYYNRPLPEMDKLEEFKKWYSQLLNSVGGSVKNLPREVWGEAVMVAAKGPEIGTVVHLTTYVEGPNDTIIFQPTDVDDKTHAGGYQHDLKLLPDWWTQ